MNQNESDLLNVIGEIEDEQSAEKISAVKVFRSLLNQPDFVAINSNDRNDTDSTTGFDTFTLNLPRPILEAESIQLVSATVPTATQNIADTSCVFFYYRLSAYKGELPSVHNLHFVRLLPSFYKKELIANAINYGYNQTFPDYESLSDELQKACKQDLGNTTWQNNSATAQEKLLIDSQYRPYDVSISYNENSNKFQMQGLNAYEPPASQPWVERTLAQPEFPLNSKVFINTGSFFESFTCLIPNRDKNPILNPLFWIKDNGDIIEEWKNNTIYAKNRIVVYFQNFYQSIDFTQNDPPNTSPAFWSLIPNDGRFVWNRYLIAGFKDENVAKLQNRLLRPWSEKYLFEPTEVIEYKGAYFSANIQTVNVIPDSVAAAGVWTRQSTEIENCISLGQTITVSCNPFLFIQKAPGTIVYISKSSNTFFNAYPDTLFITNASFYTLVSASMQLQQVVLLNTRNFTTTTPSLRSLGGVLSLRMPPDIGLSALSGQFDFASNQIGNIPSQPFSLQPKRLLNSILGFTWNGSFIDSDFGPNYRQNVPMTLRNVDVAIINKTRPLPYYIIVPTITGTDTLGPVRSVLFTADSYCNLVYSSTVQVYASVVQGSTLNSTTSTGLLGSVMLSAKNLGIAFFQEGFSAPLSIYGSDIFSLTIQLKDDMDEPYFLPNSAVVVLVLKMTFK